MTTIREVFLAPKSVVFCLMYAVISVGLWLLGTSSDSAVVAVLYTIINFPFGTLVFLFQVALSIPEWFVPSYDNWLMPLWLLAAITVGPASYIQAQFLLVLRWTICRRKAARTTS